MKDKIKTAEEFIDEYLLKNNSDIQDIGYWDTEEIMIEFAKYHVNRALQESLESIPCLGSSTDIASYEEVEKEVLNCYPENNIK